MTVVSLEVTYHLDTVSSQKIEAPRWDEVEMAILQMDNSGSSEVGLYDDTGRTMLIGGGNNNYIGMVSHVDGGFSRAVDPSQGDELVLVVIGGQSAEYPASACVGLDVILMAAKTFYEKADLEKSVTWISE